MHPRTFVRDTLGTALGQYVARAALLLRGVVAAAALGPLGFGAWNALNLLLDYGAYASAGALQGLDLDLPPAAARGDRERARRVMGGAWSVTLGGCLLFALATVVYLATGTRSIAWTWGWGAPMLMLFAVGLHLTIQYHTASLRAHGEFQRASAALAIQAVLGGGLGTALVGPTGVWGLLWGWIAGSIAAMVCLRRGQVRPPVRPWGWGGGGALVRLGLPLAAYFLASLVLRSVDRIAFVRYAGTEGLGLYSLGLMASGLILYLPEAAAAVLFPRMSAAARGAREPEHTRAQVVRTQRALTLVLPPMVALGMVWAGPLIARLLPAFRDGIPALHILAIGALLLSASTLPGYSVLAAGPRGALLGMTCALAVGTAALVFSVAARDHRPASIALAAASGYAAFALGLVALALPGLCPRPGDRLRLVASSFLPAAWAGALALLACALGAPDSAGAALVRSGAVALAYLPVLWWFGRGVGLRGLAREWLSGRVAPA